MMGAMSATAVRHERRKKHKKDKRPKKLLLKPYQEQQDGAMSPTGGHASRAGSRVGSPTHGNNHNGVEAVDDLDAGSVHYGDECFYGKVSLLHFVIFLILGGLVVLIVGLVQLKKEATLNFFKYKIIITGGVLMGIGVLLLIVKCLFFRKPIYYYDDDEDEMMAEKEAAAAIERKVAKGAESKNGDSATSGNKHPQLAITITPASDGSQSGGKASGSPSKKAQKEIETCTREEIEALTMDGWNEGSNRKSSVSSIKEQGVCSDSARNIQMTQIKQSSDNNTSKIIPVESSILKTIKNDSIQRETPSAI